MKWNENENYLRKRNDENEEIKQTGRIQIRKNMNEDNIVTRWFYKIANSDIKTFVISL